MKISDLPGIKLGDKVAIVIHTGEGKRSTQVSGLLSGIQTYADDKVALSITGLPQWIYLESNMTVTWAE